MNSAKSAVTLFRQPPRSSILAYASREPRCLWAALTAGVNATSLTGRFMTSLLLGVEAATTVRRGDPTPIRLLRDDSSDVTSDVLCEEAANVAGNYIPVLFECEMTRVK